MNCHYCGTTEREMRPYGPGGSLVCFPCATATPEREKDMEAQFGLLLAANEAISPSGATVLTADGPVPFDPADIPEGSIVREITRRP
jgi:hypothetical protein